MQKRDTNRIQRSIGISSSSCCMISHLKMSFWVKSIFVAMFVAVFVVVVFVVVMGGKSEYARSM